MKAGIAMIIFLLCVSGINAQQNLSILYELEYSLWAGYYPDLANKEITYNDRMDLKTGIETSFGKLDTLWFTIGFYQNEYEHNLRLERTGFKSSFKSLSFGYLYERAFGLGSYSNIYPKMQNVQKYDEPFLYSYCFNGIQISKEKSKSSLSARLGGNEFNDFIASASFELNQKSMFQHFSFSYTGRDNYYQDQMLSFNYEGWWKNKIFWLYGVWTAQFLEGEHLSSGEGFQNLGFIESIITISDLIKLGANCRSRFLDEDEKERDIAVLTSINCYTHEVNIIYTDTKVLKENIMQSVSISYWAHLIPSMYAGIFATEYIPEIGDRYYEAGLHVRMKK